MFDLKTAAEKTKAASKVLAGLSDEKINRTLLGVANNLRAEKNALKAANALDVRNAEDKGISAAFIDRLTLSDKVIESVAKGIEEVAALVTPRGKVLYEYRNEKQAIDITKIAVPFGVIGIIYESRPNVTADAFALCFKTGNAVMLKGGSDAINSNMAIVKVIRDTLKEYGVDENAVALVEDTSRETAHEFMRLKGYIDLLIPRGGGGLIDWALENATVPVIETGKGNCHVYVDEFADKKKAVKVIENAKTQRYGVCNACESLLINSAVADFLPDIVKPLDEKGVEIRCDETSYELLKDKGLKRLARATEKDFYTEYDDAVISVKTVGSVEEAIECVNEYGTHHSDSIITENGANAEKFLNGVDSACVYLNASTRFSDGFVFGLGAEIGISTQKPHARGPMGLDALVTTKFVVKGDGAVRV
ncbi:MAG TPA: glutamate-5-semialdehyde dehydrogenase [Clostridiales bacterium]|nr:glutamate-5-semialdehyde dehydrogenase [Clostridiales bacterium]